MATKKPTTEKRRRGRPPTGEMPVIPVRLPDAVLAEVDVLADRDGVSRSEEIRRLVTGGITARKRRRGG